MGRKFAESACLNNDGDLIASINRNDTLRIYQSRIECECDNGGYVIPSQEISMTSYNAKELRDKLMGWFPPPPVDNAVLFNTLLDRIDGSEFNEEVKAEMRIDLCNIRMTMMGNRPKEDK